MANSLILLIGTNPLPNYVVAEYLLSSQQSKPINEIWLVHSEERESQAGTKETADRLKEIVLKKHPNISLKYCSLSDVGNANQIQTDIKGKLIEYISGTDGVVHFNYTGGTKAMSVHVYRMVERSDKFQKKDFSYLDAREFVLKDDESGIVTGDLRNKVSISLEDLIKLHGYEKKENKNYNWSDALKIFKEFIDNSTLDKFLSWKKGVIRTLYYDENGKFIESVNKIRDKLEARKYIFDNHIFKDDALALLKKIPKEHSILDEKGATLWIPDAATTNSQYKERVGPAIRDFIDGKWLEGYALMILSNGIKKQFPDNNNISIACNWELIRQPGGKPFELDVIILNGYQVCGMSCTTDTQEGKCKEKGFEILHRVNQVGGEEAKAVLITCLSHNYSEGDQVTKVEKDLRYETGGEDKLIVLGIEDLKEDILWEKIKRHIWG